MKYPLLRLNEAIVKQNLQKMLEKTKTAGVHFRPHFKTHQSVEIGSWFRDAGINSITVSSLEMADYFAKAGWNNITVAFPVDVTAISYINELASKTNLTLITDQILSVNKLESVLETPVSVMIELNPGYGRSGINFYDEEGISVLIDLIESSSKLKFAGFYTHAGQTYASSSVSEIKASVKPVFSQLKKLKTRFNVPVQFGDTPSCSVLDKFEEVSIIGPGNFIFYDWMQVKIGSCLPAEIAVTMECPVTNIYKDRKELVIHGGAVHFSKEFLLDDNGNKQFGVIKNVIGKEDLRTKSIVMSLSQEHGVIKASDELMEQVQIGDVLSVYPVHSCLSANLMGRYINSNNQVIDHYSGQRFK